MAVTKPYKFIGFGAMAEVYSWVFDTWFLGRPEIVGFRGLGGPGGPLKPSQQVGGEAPHLLEWFLGAAGLAGPKTMY